MASTAGAEPLMGPRDLGKAKALIKEAGYNGEKVVLLDPTDYFVMHSLSLVTADLLRRLGINVEVQSMDWGTLVSRRALESPIDESGWNIFLTMFPGFAILDPGTDPALRADGGAAWFGWPNDPAIEKLREAWLAAPDGSARKTLAADLQREAFKSVPYIPLGEFSARTAFHNNLTGVDLGPALFMWNVTKNRPEQSSDNSH